MGTERMSCCGALTKVYADAGDRKHEPGCERKAALDELQRLLDNPDPDEVVAVTKTGRKMTNADFEALADEAERGYDVSHLTQTERQS
jgi:hypothetical protein